MDQETLKLRRLSAQYLLAPDSRLHVVRAMDGFQAQFLSNAMHAMRLRSADPDAGYAADGLVKSWTLRGTMHLFAEADLPLFLHDGCRYHSRDWTVPSFWNQRPDWALTPQRQAYFSDLIVDTLTQGPMTREALKVRCRAAGMTEAEEASMFHPWGGGIRELCERGFLCGTASEEKAFRLCPPFVPMAREDALQEQLRRYLASFGPVSLRDAAYFFALPQARLRALLMQLPVSADSFDGQTLYSLDDGREAGDALPDCLLLAGFDPLMLGYEKKQSIFSSAGIPARHFQPVRHRHAAGPAAGHSRGPVETQRKTAADHRIPAIYARRTAMGQNGRDAALAGSGGLLSGGINRPFQTEKTMLYFS